MTAAKPRRSWRIEASGRPSSPYQEVLSRLARDPGFVLGATTLAITILVAVFAPILSPYDPVQMPPGVGLQAPSPAHWMGTDNFGRDILSRVIWGARLSLGVGLIADIIATVVGTAWGLIAGYAGGWIDLTTSWIVDILMAFPGILLALAVVAVLGPSLFNVLLAVGIACIPGFTRLVRGSTLAAKERCYVEAARCVGASPLRIVFKHILPNVLSTVLVWASLTLAGMILSASGLSFLGLGAQPPSPEWGAMINVGRRFLRQGWWMSAFPGLAIVVAVLSINLIGDALRDALDPRLRFRR